MKAVVVGYGKMGRTIERLASEYGIEVVCRVDPVGGDADAITEESLAGADVAFEFTTPETAVGNILALCEHRIDCVVGTTGWFDELGRVRDAVERSGNGCVYAPNFSIGMNLFFRLIPSVCEVFSSVDDVRFGVEEHHHEAKKDAPSGTALRILDILRENGVEVGEGAVTALRLGYIPGTHTIRIDLPFESIEIRHSLRQREALAYGALLAARLIKGKKGLYSFESLLEAV